VLLLKLTETSFGKNLKMAKVYFERFCKIMNKEK